MSENIESAWNGFVVWCPNCEQWSEDVGDELNCPECNHKADTGITPIVPVLNYLRRIAIALEDR